MSNTAMYDQLDQAVSALIAKPGDAASYVSTFENSAEIGELLEIAAQLEYVARPGFKAQLRDDLQDEIFVGDVASYVSTLPYSPGRENGNSDHRAGTQAQTAKRQEQILPSLFGTGGMYSAQRKNFAASALLHATALGALIASSAWMAQRTEAIKPRVTTVLTDVGVYSPKPAREQQQKGGGAGGDQDPMSASHGQPPKFAHEQFAPPTVIVRNPEPVLTTPPTVLGQPDQSLPQLSKLGDPLSHVVPASNGIGSSAGVGSNRALGVGNGDGPGAGSGSGGGMGTGLFTVGGGVSAPRVLYAPDPEYSDEARKARYQGTVVLWAVIGPDGLPKELRVRRALGMGLDQKAVEAVRRWRFEPATKGGQPVAVQVNIEVNFRLF